MISCPQCNTQNADGSKFCKSCRTPIPKSEQKLRCKNGHIIDPSWNVCPLCHSSVQGARPVKSQSMGTSLEDRGPASENFSGARRKTVPEGNAVYNPSIPSSIPSSSTEPELEPQKAVTETPQRPRRRTVVDTGQSSDVKEKHKKNRLVAFLVTYSSDPMGQYFEVREGRHVIGSGSDADICVPGDTMMSSQHAVLLYRRGKFLFQDQLSTNGSFINGEEAFGQIELSNYNEILMGNTSLRLIMTELQSVNPASR